VQELSRTFVYLGLYEIDSHIAWGFRSECHWAQRVRPHMTSDLQCWCVWRFWICHSYFREQTRSCSFSCAAM